MNFFKRKEYYGTCKKITTDINSLFKTLRVDNIIPGNVVPLVRIFQSSIQFFSNILERLQLMQNTTKTQTRSRVDECFFLLVFFESRITNSELSDIRKQNEQSVQNEIRQSICTRTM